MNTCGKTLAKPRLEPKVWPRKYSPPGDWIISATAYREEFHKIVKTQVQDSIQDRIASIQIGQTGYAFVLGGNEENKGAIYRL